MPFRRTFSWLRVWRVPMTTTDAPVTLTKTAGEGRDFVFDFSAAPEVALGETISSPVISGGVGLTVGTPAVLVVKTDDVPARKGVKVRISGGAAGTVYNFACQVTCSGGGTPVVPARLVVVADYGSS